MRTVNLLYKGYDPLNGEEWIDVNEAVLSTDRVAVLADGWGSVRFYVFGESIKGDAIDEAKADVVSIHLSGIDLESETAAELFRDFALFLE